MTTTDYIPFINTVTDCEVATKLYSDAAGFRISAESAAETCAQVPAGPTKWIDPAIDGLHQPDLSKFKESYANHIARFTGYQKLASPGFQAAPEKAVVQQFVFQ